MGRWLGVWLCCGLVTGALAQEEAPAEPPPAAPVKDVVPEPAKAVWEVFGDLILPLDQLLDRGLVLLKQKGQAAGAVLSLIQLADGKVVWSVPLPSDVQSANVAGDTLILALRDVVLGINVPDGTELWRQPLTWRIDTGWAVSPQFGQSQWFKDRSITGQGIGGGIAVVGDRFCLCVQGTAYGAEARTGQIVWQRKLGFSLSYPFMPCGDAILGATSNNGFGRVAMADGKVVWGQQVNGLHYLQAMGEEIYAGHPDRGLQRLDPATGQPLWTASFKSEPKMKLTIVGDRLVVQLDQQVAIVARDDGRTLFTAATTGLHSALQDGVLCYHHGETKTIHAVTVADATEKWVARPRDPGVWSLHAAGPSLVVMAPGTVEALDLATGANRWARTSGAGQLFDTATWASDDRTVFVHLPRETRGYDVVTGAWALRMLGKFFFVHWMHLAHDTLYLHSGAPGEASLGAIPLGR